MVRDSEMHWLYGERIFVDNIKYQDETLYSFEMQLSFCGNYFQ